MEDDLIADAPVGIARVSQLPTNSVQYKVIFDVSQGGYRHWWFPAFGLILVVIGTVLFRIRHGLPARTPRLFPHFFLGFAIFWTVIGLVGTAAGHFVLAAALRAGRCEVAEGIVTDFHPFPATGKGKESFIVSGKRFEYSDFILNAGFNHTTFRGGPMSEGLMVRIHHLRGDIARLEVAR